MTALLKAEQVSKAFRNGAGEVTALTDVSLELPEGAFAALTGPSGSGKTTLLTLLGCLDRPTQGRILFDGKDTGTLSRTALAEQRLNSIGFIFQDYNLIPTLSALENVEYVLWLQRKSGRSQRREAERLAAGGHQEEVAAAVDQCRQLRHELETRRDLLRMAGR